MNIYTHEDRTKEPASDNKQKDPNSILISDTTVNERTTPVSVTNPASFNTTNGNQQTNRSGIESLVHISQEEREERQEKEYDKGEARASVLKTAASPASLSSEGRGNEKHDKDEEAGASVLKTAASPDLISLLSALQSSNQFGTPETASELPILLNSLLSSFKLPTSSEAISTSQTSSKMDPSRHITASTAERNETTSGSEYSTPLTHDKSPHEIASFASRYASSQSISPDSSSKENRRNAFDSAIPLGDNIIMSTPGKNSVSPKQRKFTASASLNDTQKLCIAKYTSSTMELNQIMEKIREAFPNAKR